MNVQVSEAKQKLQSAIDSLGLSMSWKFVPWSQSRNKAEKQPSLNWVITLCNRNGTNAILSTDYMAGSGHCPSYKYFDSNACRAMAVDAECETGYAHKITGMNPMNTRKEIAPDMCDVVHSLVSDSDVLNCSSFEEWADNLGFESDSRKAEAIYRQCLGIALKLRNAIGEQGLNDLQEAGQDY